MTGLYRLRGRDEATRRRALLPPPAVVEVWPDLVDPGACWVGDGARTLLEGSGPSLPVDLVVPSDAIAVYYGPYLRDLESLPTEESVRVRTVSAHGIAVAWTTYGPDGRRNDFDPSEPGDATFHLRRPRGDRAHLWRLFRTRAEAIIWAAQTRSADAEAARWADGLAVSDFADLLARLARPS